MNNGNAGPGDVANRPTPPPPPALVDIRVCVIDAQGALTEVAAHFNPATGDTTAAGKRFGEAYPADRRYASKASWYINNEPVLVGGRRFVKYGLPRTIGVSEVTRATAHQGVGVFVERGVALGRVAVIYLPLRHGCEFQPYQVQAKK